MFYFELFSIRINENIESKEYIENMISETQMELLFEICLSSPSALIGFFVYHEINPDIPDVLMSCKCIVNAIWAYFRLKVEKFTGSPWHIMDNWMLLVSGFAIYWTLIVSFHVKQSRHLRFNALYSKLFSFNRNWIPRLPWYYKREHLDLERYISVL